MYGSLRALIQCYGRYLQPEDEDVRQLWRGISSNLPQTPKLSIQSCENCSGSFCQDCLTKNDRGYICKRCDLLRADLIEREELEKLSVINLHHFVTARGIQLPSHTAHDRAALAEAILIEQAQRLTDRALRAQCMLMNPAVMGERDWVNVQRDSPSLSGRGEGDVKQFDPSSVGNLSDLSSEEQIRLLPVRQLKIILQRNCIDYKGCVEKDELRERVERLWQARKKEREIESKISMAGDSAAEQEFLCKICMDSPVDCVLLECGHMMTCVRCGRQLSECPVCRQYVTRVVHAFRV